MSGDVLFFAEERGGNLRRAALEAAAVARQLADALGGRACGVLVGSGVAPLAEILGKHGADEVHVADAPNARSANGRTLADLVVALAKRRNARAIVFVSSALGKDVAPRVAALLGAGYASDTVAVSAAAGGPIRVVKPVYSGKLRATYAFHEAAPAVIGVRPNVIAPKEAPRSASVEALAFEPGKEAERARAIGVKAAEGGRVDLGEARVIVSGGRGVRGPENFPMIQALADAMGGAMGASRAAVDAGWIDHSHQVGQTGRTVSPDLYVACGISGAIQHLAGMSSSRVIVAINKDPEAPIFKVADYGIVGDLFEIVPILTEKARALRAD